MPVSKKVTPLAVSSMELETKMVLDEIIERVKEVTREADETHCQVLCPVYYSIKKLNENMATPSNCVC